MPKISSASLAFVPNFLALCISILFAAVFEIENASRILTGTRALNSLRMHFLKQERVALATERSCQKQKKGDRCLELLHTKRALGAH